MQADTAYGSDENAQQAAALGVELVSPVPGAKPTETSSPASDIPVSRESSTASAASAESSVPALEQLTIDDFAVDERTGKVNACPSGRIPLNVVYDAVQEKTTIEMDAKDCASCPFQQACPINKNKKGKYTLDYTAKQRRTEERRRESQTDAFRERYAKRSGIESTNSGLKRKHGLGRLRIRGSPAVAHALYLKIAGWNLNQAAASGKLASRVAEILKKLGFGGWWLACAMLYCLPRPVRSLCRNTKVAGGASRRLPTTIGTIQILLFCRARHYSSPKTFQGGVWVQPSNSTPQRTV